MACDNTGYCPCTYSCPHHGKCCECVRVHRKGELPACFFSEEVERTYDRSARAYAKDQGII